MAKIPFIMPVCKDKVLHFLARRRRGCTVELLAAKVQRFQMGTKRDRLETLQSLINEGKIQVVGELDGGRNDPPAMIYLADDAPENIQAVTTAPDVVPEWKEKLKVIGPVWPKMQEPEPKVKPTFFPRMVQPNEVKKYPESAPEAGTEKTITQPKQEAKKMQEEVINPTAKNLRETAEKMMRAAEEAERRAAENDRFNKQFVPARRKVLLAVNKTKLQFDALIDAMAELEQAAAKLEEI